METTPIEQVPWRRSQRAETFASVRVSATCYRFTKYVCFFPVVKSELKFGKVPRQTFLANTAIAAQAPRLNSDQNDSFEFV